MTASCSSDHYLLGEEKSALRRYRLFNEVYQPATAERTFFSGRHGLTSRSSS